MTTTPHDASEAPVIELTAALLDSWATDFSGPVAVHLKQRLLSVEAVDGNPGIIYPPTYANIGYNIDPYSDNKKVALIDSVGSQANRMEPIFKYKFTSSGEGGTEGEYLVPQIEIILRTEKAPKQDKTEPYKEKRSILDLAHRGADAVIQSTPTLKPEFEKAFEALRRTGDAGPLCALAPTSLVFGVWDSRGGSGEKRPRLVRAIIRAWDVDVLHAAAQFTSVWKLLDKSQKDELEKAGKVKKKKDDDDGETKLSSIGLADAPAVFKPKTKLPKFLHGAPNPEARVLGGVFVRDRIERDVTVNLLALRNIRGANDEEAAKIRKYLLGLSLIAATTEIDLFLREGCHLRYANDDVWRVVPRRGQPAKVNLGSDAANSVLLKYALDASTAFFKDGKIPAPREHQFDLSEAKKLLAKKDEENPSED